MSRRPLTVIPAIGWPSNWSAEIVEAARNSSAATHPARTRESFTRQMAQDYGLFFGGGGGYCFIILSSALVTFFVFLSVLSLTVSVAVPRQASFLAAASYMSRTSVPCMYVFTVDVDMPPP